MIVTTTMPVRGDGVIGDLSTGKVIYIKAEYFTGVDELDLTAYELIGVVVERLGRNVLIAYYQNDSKVWSKRYTYKLTGYTLDGTDRSGILSVRSASDSWAANVQYTINYNATTAAELVAQLNTYFAANAPFTTQDWYAEVNGDGDIDLSFDYVSWQQSSYTTGTSGFTLSANFMPDVIGYANMLRRHGGTGGEGALSSYYRAITYFAQDLSSTTYNPSSDVTSIKRTYPVCKPAYLGTSTYQSDHCALLRQTYGAGEEGWLKFMESCMPVVSTDFGNMGMTDGLARTKVLAEKTYSSLTKTNEVLCPAANYAYNIGTTCIPQGQWFMGTTRDIYYLLRDVTYSSHGDNNSDPINAMLNKMNGSAISNGSHWWSCCRYSASHTWYALGNGGYFGNNNLCNSFGAVPLSLQKLY